MDTLLQHVEKLYQQVNILQEYIEMKFGSDFKDFENFKFLHPTKTKLLITKEDHVFDDHFPSPPNTITEDGNNLTSDTAWERNIVITNVRGMEDVETKERLPPSSISVTATAAKMREQLDFYQSSPITTEVHKNGKDAAIYYGGPVTPHRDIPAAVSSGSVAGSSRSYRRKRPGPSADYTLHPCDYCAQGWRSSLHYKDAHRDMCVFQVGSDGCEVLVGYRCPRPNCDREGRLLSTIDALGRHVKGDCTLKRKRVVNL